MSKQKLPIEDETEDLSSLREKLNEPILTEDCLNKIEDLFGVNKREFVYINCDGAHGHTFKCLGFARYETMITDRLLEELRKYQQVVRNFDKSITETLKRYNLRG